MIKKLHVGTGILVIFLVSSSWVLQACATQPTIPAANTAPVPANTQTAAPSATASAVPTITATPTITPAPSPTPTVAATSEFLKIPETDFTCKIEKFTTCKVLPVDILDDPRFNEHLDTMRTSFDPTKFKKDLPPLVLRFGEIIYEHKEQKAIFSSSSEVPGAKMNVVSMVAFPDGRKYMVFYYQVPDPSDPTNKDKNGILKLVMPMFIIGVPGWEGGEI